MVRIIAYDLTSGTEQEYQALHQAIRNLVRAEDENAYQHIQQSVWAIRSGESCQDIFRKLRHCLHPQSKLLVAETGHIESEPAFWKDPFLAGFLGS